MSHNLLFKRYVCGEEAPYDFEVLREILLRHGGEVGKPQDVGDQTTMCVVCVSAGTWDEAAKSLGRYMQSEYEN